MASRAQETARAAIRDLDRPAVGIRASWPVRHGRGASAAVGSAEARFELSGLELFLLGMAGLSAWWLGLFAPKAAPSLGEGSPGLQESQDQAAAFRAEHPDWTWIYNPANGQWTGYGPSTNTPYFPPALPNPTGQREADIQAIYEAVVPENATVAEKVAARRAARQLYELEKRQRLAGMEPGVLSAGLAGSAAPVSVLAFGAPAPPSSGGAGAGSATGP